MQNKNAILIIVLLAGFLAPLIFIMGFNYLNDPFQYYNLVDDEPYGFKKNARWQNPGLLKHLDYDTVIIGTSRSENFSSQMFKDSDWKVLKATASGSSSLLHKKTALFAIQQGKVKRVIIELDYPYYLRGRNYLNQKHSFPEFLYTPTLETPFLYLLSFDLLKKSYEVCQNRDLRYPLDILYQWYPRHKHKFGKLYYVGRLKLNCTIDESILFQSPPFNKKISDAIKINLKELLNRYDNIQFIGYMPPRPLLWYYHVQPWRVQQNLFFRKEIAKLDKYYKNFKVFDFQIMTSVVNDPGRFKDIGHYDIETQKQIASELINESSPYRIQARKYIKQDPISKIVKLYNVKQLAICGGSIGKDVLSVDYDDIFKKAERIRRKSNNDPKKLKKAFGLYYNAANSTGDPKMRLKLAQCYYQGWGTRKDKTKAALIVMDDTFDYDRNGLYLRALLYLDKGYKGYAPLKAIMPLKRATAMGHKRAKEKYYELSEGSPHILQLSL